MEKEGAGGQGRGSGSQGYENLQKALKTVQWLDLSVSADVY